MSYHLCYYYQFWLKGTSLFLDYSNFLFCLLTLFWPLNVSVRSCLLCSKLLHGFLSFMNKCSSSYHDLPYINQDDSWIRTFAFTLPSKIHTAYSLNSLGIFLLLNVLSMYYAWLLYLKFHLTYICGTSFLGFLVYCSPWHVSPLDIKFCFYLLTVFLSFTKM